MMTNLEKRSNGHIECFPITLFTLLQDRHYSWCRVRLPRCPLGRSATEQWSPGGYSRSGPSDSRQRNRFPILASSDLPCTRGAEISMAPCSSTSLRSVCHVVVDEGAPRGAAHLPQWGLQLHAGLWRRG
jgi:hypothetical protein